MTSSRAERLDVSLAARLVEVIADLGADASPRYRYGSGCIVAGRTVLTAAHVVADALRVRIRTVHKDLYDASLDSRFVGQEFGPAPDLALVEIDGAWAEFPALELARLDRDATAESSIDCHAYGYPWFAEQPSPEVVSEVVDVIGEIPVLAKLVTGLATVQVRKSPGHRALEDRVLDESAWSGMSGGPVISGGRLVGVVIEHALREGQSSITMAPITLLEPRPDYPKWGTGVPDPTAWWRRLGVTSAADLVVLPAPKGWTRLLALDEQARATVVRSLALGSSNELILPRSGMRDELKAALIADGDIIVVGDSGVGKSALVMDAIAPDQLGADRQAVALNLRHLPTSQLELLALLSSPLEELLSELTAPERLLVIDAAEAAVEDHQDILLYCVRAARTAGVQAAVVTSTEGIAVVRQLLRSGAEGPREFTVAGLNDVELNDIAAHFPALRRLVDNPRARELLRRPIVVDLLGRAGDPGLPLSESQALDHVWQHLVRNSGRRDQGTPDARENTMLSLANYALHKGDTDDLLARLDHDAVDGLRRTGLLQPASSLPWERVPSFRHDLLRAYSVARLLLAERDPAASLTAAGAARWTLPSARLACEIMLSAPDDLSYPRAGRFAGLQAGFNAIAKSGGGERWSDIPTEALLVAPDLAVLLRDAWPVLTEDRAQGTARIIRILNTRHRRDGMLDSIAAEPVIARLLDAGTPSAIRREADELVRDWLRTLVLRRIPRGHPLRIELCGAIVDQCRANEQALDEQEAARRAELAARTPEQVAEDEARVKRLNIFDSSGISRRGSSGPSRTRHRPYQWINDQQVEHLALLGPDLGEAGEAILRRIAEDEPHSLDHAVEPLLAGHSLASYSTELLVYLAAEYYIDQPDEDDNGYESHGGLHDDGIRDHAFFALGPLAHFAKGPFLALFRADYLKGVSLLNRMLDHAARCRVRQLSSLRHGSSAEDDDESKQVLSIIGEPREYVGDGHVWLWYRGTGVGPYPCMSALQALELVTEEHIRAGVPPQALTSILVKDAHNLAMPALALGVLVRHLEVVGGAVDPFLVEPAVWQLEFSRSSQERSSGLAARVPELSNPERRTWSLRETSMALTLSAETDRLAELKAVGEQLRANARARVGDEASAAARQYLATVQNWAAALDRNTYEVTPHDKGFLIQQTSDPEVEEVLGETNEALRRTSDAIGLTVRHAHVRDKGGWAPDVDTETLTADLLLAKAIWENPPEPRALSIDGPVAVAASALELHLTSRAAVSDDDLIWSAQVLLQVAAATTSRDDIDDDTVFGYGADRSAGRALPLLLLPAAVELRSALGVLDVGGLDELIALSRAVAVHGANETRLAYARGLDDVWASPCDTTHLFGRCHHRVAFDLVTESFLRSSLGPWDREEQRRPVVALDPPNARSLDALTGGDILVSRLTAALRATGAAAVSPACSAEDAQQALRSLVAAHQRAMLASKHGYHHSQSDALVAARAALLQAIGGRDEPVLDYVHNYLGRGRPLAEALKAIAAAAEERVEVGRQAQRLWPKIMDKIIDAAQANPSLFLEQSWGGYVESALIPNPAAEWGYLTIELAGEPYRWRNLLAWAPQVNCWLGAVPRSRMSIDHLVVAVRELDVSDQIEQGLIWIERIVAGAGESCALTHSLPEWLRERRPDIATPDHIARWQRVVDCLVVAGDTRVADLAD
ncbi:serine protease [Micromonospora sp. NBC_00330]|uniref:serine protease n=1 Tax=Micromonospora sp. NBC_00330 TaxID=2903585 RepID=UPI002E2D95A2|nr:serine protease [Micromonospora sp. NBC_00330]